MLITSNLQINMLKKSDSVHSRLSGHPFKALLILLAVGFLAFSLPAQNEELKQKVEALKNDKSEEYDVKFLNISSPDLGYIDKTSCEWKDRFMLKSKKKAENNLGNRSYQKFYINVYSYSDLTDRQYALKDWMGDFLEGKSIRAARDMRSYDYATPTIILINDESIITLNYKCSDFSDDNFRDWKDEMLKYFGEDNTMVIEVLCDGPLKWTKNAPDPKEARGLF